MRSCLATREEAQVLLCTICELGAAACSHLCPIVECPRMQITFFDLKWKISKEFLPAVSSIYCLEVQKCELVRNKHVRQALEHGQLLA